MLRHPEDGEDGRQRACLAKAELLRVEEEGRGRRPTRYRVNLLRDAGMTAGWAVPALWREALRGQETRLVLDLLDAEDRSLLEGMYEGLGQLDRDRYLRDAIQLLRARGWRRPEVDGEGLERMMKELVLQRTFGPERLRKYRERGERAAETGERLGP